MPIYTNMLQSSIDCTYDISDYISLIHQVKYKQYTFHLQYQWGWRQLHCMQMAG